MSSLSDFNQDSSIDGNELQLSPMDQSYPYGLEFFLLLNLWFQWHCLAQNAAEAGKVFSMTRGDFTMCTYLLYFRFPKNFIPTCLINILIGYFCSSLQLVICSSCLCYFIHFLVDNICLSPLNWGLLLHNQ